MKYSNNLVGDLPLPLDSGIWLVNAAAAAATMPLDDALRDALALVDLLKARADSVVRS